MNWPNGKENCGCMTHGEWLKRKEEVKQNLITIKAELTADEADLFFGAIRRYVDKHIELAVQATTSGMIPAAKWYLSHIELFSETIMKKFNMNTEYLDGYVKRIKSMLSNMRTIA